GYRGGLGGVEGEGGEEEGERELDRIAARLQQQSPRPSGHGARIVSLHEQTVGDVRPVLLILLGAVSLVLLIACANGASLMLARATERYKEMPIRPAFAPTPPPISSP